MSMTPVAIPAFALESKQLLSQPIARTVSVVMQRAEFFFNPKAGGSAEEIRELDRLAVRFGSAQLFGAQAGSRDGKQLSADLDKTAQ